MKIRLIVRGSQGDAYPYLEIGKALKKRGHDVTISVTKEFAGMAKDFNLPYTVLEGDDITNMLDASPGFGGLLSWMDRVIKQQFDDYVEVFTTNDLVVAANTEFAAPHVAEYCNKPLIRTCFAPLLPGKNIFPPLLPIMNPPRFIPNKAAWDIIALGLEAGMGGNINKRRKHLGMKPVKGIAEYMARQSDNLLLYSPNLGEIDTSWPFRYHAMGYCFNDDLQYSPETLETIKNFVQKDKKPTLFFTMGSIKHKKRDIVCKYLHEICKKQGWKLIIGAGWWKTGFQLLELPENERHDLLIFEGIIPHKLIFPYFDAIIHHGGSGTTHSAARAGIPQLILPVLIDQFYWVRRVHDLGLGPVSPGMGGANLATLETKAIDLMTNAAYKENAEALKEKINEEDGLDAVCDYVARVGALQ
jgi:UDP:flavonoid glycosyltransferase YjiC (YdhE family)